MTYYIPDMSTLQAVTLGVIQGLTEFLPVSSSGHLIILPYLFHWETQPLVFDTVLHLSTLVAVFYVFWKDFLVMVKDFLGGFFSGVAFKEYSPEGKRLVYLALGSVPATILGLLLDSYIENVFRNVSYVLIFLMFGTALLFFAEKVKSRNMDLDLTLRKSIVIGMFQSLALLPGVSRSGSTISGAMFMGLNREAATRFSFMLSVPIIMGASFFKIVSTFNLLSAIPLHILLAGFLSGLISGILAIKLLLKLVKNNSLNIFVAYRIVLIIILAFLLYRA